MSEELEKQLKKLERELRITKKKLERSEENRAVIEESKDRFDTMYQHILGERELAERELSAKEAQLRMAMDNMPGAMWVVDDNLMISLINNQYADFYGDSGDLMQVGKSMVDVIRFEAEAGLLSGGTGEVEKLVDERIASYRSAEMSVFEDQTPEGLHIHLVRKPTTEGYVISVATDITGRKLAEKELAQTLAEQNAVMSAIDYGVIFMDSDLRTRLINEAGRKIWGYEKSYVDSHPTMADLIYHNRYNNLYPVADESFDEYVVQRVQTVKDGTIPPTEVERADGSILRYQNIVLPEGGRMLTYLDITDTVLAERKLKDAFDVISSSINYASRIQRSLLPDDGILTSVVHDHFVLWEPRDVVGGDIYWHGAWGNGCLIVLGDCTGHGVPGAFMTLIAIGALERAMSEIEGGEVGKLISRVHQYIQVSLSQHYGGGESDDGIELGACYFVPEEPNLTFVGARFDLFTIEGEDIFTAKGTKSGMGYRGVSYDQLFEEIIVDVTPGKSFYLTTDGLIDQVGGERARMYGKKRFRELLMDIQDKPMSDQKETIYQAMMDYMGDQIRRDDVAVIGFRV